MPYRPPSALRKTLETERNQIAHRISEAVNDSFQKAQQVLVEGVGEIEKLIFFFMEGLPQIEGSLNELLSQHRVMVTVSGIYCHKTPIVRSISPSQGVNGCELGDMAFLATYDNNRDLGQYLDGWGNGILMQAKEAYNPRVQTVQKELYEKSRRFRYTSPHPLTGQERSLSKKINSLYYWDFSGGTPTSSEHSNSYSYTTSILARPGLELSLPPFEPFGQTLASLFCGQSGRGFQKKPEGTGWSRIIHDLIENAATRSISHSKIFSPRGVKPSRLYNYPAWILSAGRPTSLVRCSLAEFLKAFPDNALKDIGEKFEAEAKIFDLDEFKSRDKGNLDGGSTAPPSKLREQPNDDDYSGGGNFVVFQFAAIDKAAQTMSTLR
jgi:hypothetical protein